MTIFTPLIFCLLGYSSTVAGLQSNKISVRCASAALLCLSGAKTLQTLTEAADIPALVNLGPLAMIGMAHGITLLLIEYYELPSIKTGKKRFDIHGGMHMVLNSRYIGTSKEVPGLQTWPVIGKWATRRWLSSIRRDNPKWAFVIDRLITVLFLVALLKVVPQLPLGASDVHPKKTSLFRRLSSVSRREVWLRCLLPLYFVLENWASLNATYQGFAALTVAVGIYGPNDWPRLFGDPTAAYSLRRFWSKFWHRLVLRPLLDYDDFVCLCAFGGISYGGDSSPTL
ncbi:putative Membrane bound O-acyl transferase family-domain-containing protein [Seiridium unicorne]|uniref:Membrane bound O-acyl transferase family-domain-containing protein n=1 Tax=Seiridium unicorne TaxID=138068 RepID=A0ABR2UXN1_9PEZI